MRFLVTGGAGFIGSAVIRHVLASTEHSVFNLDLLTYAGNLDSLDVVNNNSRYEFEKCDIRSQVDLKRIFNDYQPNWIMHLAAESHVDRSIDSPAEFVSTNVLGTFCMLEEARAYWSSLNRHDQSKFRFHHISTDEVFGDLGGDGTLFTETTPYSPSSPYSASKASSDHFVRAWGRTYGLPILLSNCSNNYGPFHFPEKLIPHMILNAMHGGDLPVYGDGSQVRDWLFVEDHAKALYKVVSKGVVGETYNIGGHNEKTNLQVVETICDLLEELRPSKPVGVSRYRDLISFVKDRPGHDIRYAIDASKIKADLGWVPLESFESGLRKTVQWYLDNPEWWERVLSGEYQLKRLGD